MGEVVVRVGGVKGGNEVGKGAATGNLGEVAKGAGARQHVAGDHLLAVGRAQAGAELEEGGMLGLQRLVNVFVELLVGASGFCRVEVTAAGDMAVGRVEVERAGDNVEVAERYELNERGARAPERLAVVNGNRNGGTMQRRHRRQRAKAAPRQPKNRDDCGTGDNRQGQPKTEDIPSSWWICVGL